MLPILIRFCRASLLGALAFAGAVPCALASSGTGESTTGTLETVPPSVTALSFSSARQATVTFDEPVTGAALAGSYAFSGSLGTLPATPASAAPAATPGAFDLSWATGEMLVAGTVQVAVSGVTDLLGNPVNPAASTASAPPLADAPVAGTATVPPLASSAPIAIPFSGASDATSGLAFVELWYRSGASAWASSGLSLSGGSGTFQFSPPGAAPASHGDYSFELVAQDAAGNRSVQPSGTTGTGQGTTVYNTYTAISEWETLNP